MTRRRIVEHIKHQESLGFAYENATASLELADLAESCRTTSRHSNLSTSW